VILRLRGAAAPRERQYSSAHRPASGRAETRAGSGVSRLQAVNDCFQAWASQAGQIGNGGNPPS
jgi:hypothetical protein